MMSSRPSLWKTDTNAVFIFFSVAINLLFCYASAKILIFISFYTIIIEEISKIKTVCQGKVLKVILETDLLTKEEINSNVEKTEEYIELAQSVKLMYAKFNEIRLDRYKCFAAAYNWL